MSRWPFITWIAIAAFVAKSLIAPGYMLAPSADGAGGFQVVICTAQGFKTVTIDETGKPVDESKPLVAADACPFGVTTTAVLSTKLPLPVPSRAIRVVHFAPPTAAFIAYHASFRLARGPPSRPATV